MVVTAIAFIVVMILSTENVELTYILIVFVS